MKTRTLLLSILICSLLLAFGQQSNNSLTGNSSRNSIPDYIRERKLLSGSEWYFNQRAFPYDTIPVIQYTQEMTREIKKPKAV